MSILNIHAVDNGYFDIYPSEYPFESTSDTVPYSDTTPIKLTDDDEMEQLLEFLHSEHDDYLLDVDLHMLQDLLAVYPSLEFYTVSTLLFHKYGGENICVKNCMSHFSIFVPTNYNVKLSNGNMVYAQEIGIVLCRFPNCLIMYSVIPVYYCPGHPSNTISLGDLKCLFVLKILHLNLLNIVIFLFSR